jgi:hypothetical protein
MFTGARFATKGIVTEVPFELQLMLWALIDLLFLQNKRLDYLQIFELSPALEGEQGQRIIHTQEQPPFKQERVLKASWEIYCGKVWIIDSGDYATMLLPEEY